MGKCCFVNSSHTPREKRTVSKNTPASIYRYIVRFLSHSIACSIRLRQRRIPLVQFLKCSTIQKNFLQFNKVENTKESRDSPPCLKSECHFCMEFLRTARNPDASRQRIIRILFFPR